MCKTIQDGRKSSRFLWILRLFFAFVVAEIGQTGSCAPINVLIIADDHQIDQLTNGLAQYPDFGDIKVVAWADEPSTNALIGYDAVVVTRDYNVGDNARLWGDICADFARAGGGVTCGFAYYSTVYYSIDYGRLQSPENNPFTLGTRVLSTATIGTNLIPGHPLMQGVNFLMTDYEYAIKPNSNAVVVATFKDGGPVTGYLDTGLGRIVGVQADFKLNEVLTNNGDYTQLYRNGVVYSVARPGRIEATQESNGIRVSWRGVGGVSYAVQAAANLMDSDSFRDITPFQPLPGAGFVSTNYLDAGALTNQRARFYRVRSL